MQLSWKVHKASMRAGFERTVVLAPAQSARCQATGKEFSGRGNGVSTQRAASLLLTNQEASRQQGDSEQRSPAAWQGVRGAAAANEVGVVRAFIPFSSDNHRLDTMHIEGMPSTVPKQPLVCMIQCLTPPCHAHVLMPCHPT